MTKEARLVILRNLGFASLLANKPNAVHDVLVEVEQLNGSLSCSDFALRAMLPPVDVPLPAPSDLAALGRFVEAVRQRRDAAVAVCRQELLTGINRETAAFHLSGLSIGVADPHLALSLATEAYRASPSERLVVNNLAFANTRLGRFSECLRYAREAVELDPLDAVVRNNLGSCFGEDDKTFQAIGHLSLAILAEAEYAHPHVSRAISTMKLRSSELRRWIPGAWHLLTFICRKDLEAAVRIEPWNWVYRVLLAHELLFQGRLEEGLRESMKGLELGGRVTAAGQFVTGKALTLLGRRTEAIAHLESALAAKRFEDREITEVRRIQLPHGLRLMLNYAPPVSDLDSWLKRAELLDDVGPSQQ